MYNNLLYKLKNVFFIFLYIDVNFFTKNSFFKEKINKFCINKNDQYIYIIEMLNKIKRVLIIIILSLYCFLSNYVESFAIPPTKNDKEAHSRNEGTRGSSSTSFSFGDSDDEFSSDENEESIEERKERARSLMKEGFSSMCSTNPEEESSSLSELREQRLPKGEEKMNRTKFSNAAAKLESFLKNTRQPQPTAEQVQAMSSSSPTSMPLQPIAARIEQDLEENQDHSSVIVLPVTISPKHCVYSLGKQTEGSDSSRPMAAIACKDKYTGEVHGPVNAEPINTPNSSYALLCNPNKSYTVKEYEKERKRWTDTNKEIEKAEQTYTSLYNLWCMLGQKEEASKQLIVMYDKNEKKKQKLAALGEKLETMLQTELIDDGDSSENSDDESSSNDEDDEHSGSDEDSDFDSDFDDDSSNDGGDLFDSDIDSDNNSSNQGTNSENEGWQTHTVIVSGNGSGQPNHAPAPVSSTGGASQSSQLQGTNQSSSSSGGTSTSSNSTSSTHKRSFTTSTNQNKLQRQGLFKKRDSSMDPTPHLNHNIIANKASLTALMNTLNNTVQETKSAMRLLKLYMNSAKLTPEKPFRVFASLNGATPGGKNKGESSQLGFLFTIPQIKLPRLWHGIAYNYAKMQSKEYQGLNAPLAKGVAQSKAESHHISFITAWNVTEPGIVAFIEGSLGRASTKNNRAFSHRNSFSINEGKTHSYTHAGVANVGYNIPITKKVMCTPYIELSSISGRWNAYKEKSGTLPARISRTKQVTIEHRAGLKTSWNINEKYELQTWGAVISGKTQNGKGLTATNLKYNIKTSTSKVKKNYVQGEVGASFDVKVTKHMGVGVNAAVWTKESKKGLGSGNIGVHLWYEF